MLTLIAREGDLLDVDDGPRTDFRKVSFLNFNRPNRLRIARTSGFNDLGQVAFRATFTDGTSGVFVSNLVAVPEPSSLALLALRCCGAVASGADQRHQRLVQLGGGGDGVVAFFQTVGVASAACGDTACFAD